MKGIGTSIKSMVKGHTRMHQVAQNIKVCTTKYCEILFLYEHG